MSAALNYFWIDVVRPLILNEQLNCAEREVAETFGGALLSVSSCHKVLSGFVSEQGRSFPQAILDVLPSLRDAYLKYTRLFHPTFEFSNLLSKYVGRGPLPIEGLGNLDTSPTSIIVMPMQVLPKYNLLLRDASKEGGFDGDAIRSAIEGVESLCRELEWIRRKADNAERISALTSSFGPLLHPETTLLDDCVFEDSKGRALRALLCDDSLLVLSFKDRECLRLKTATHIVWKDVRSVRCNSAHGCMDIELLGRSGHVMFQLFSGDSLLLSQWTLSLSLAIDRATTPI